MRHFHKCRLRRAFTRVNSSTSKQKAYIFYGFYPDNIVETPPNVDSEIHLTRCLPLVPQQILQNSFEP